jgi:hypothetical protein
MQRINRAACSILFYYAIRVVRSADDLLAANAVCDGTAIEITASAGS